MENVVEFFQNNSQVVEEIYGPIDGDSSFLFSEKVEEFRVYKSNMVLKNSVFAFAHSTHSFFLYPLGYDETIQPIFDKLNPQPGLDSLFYMTAKGVLYLAVLFSFISVIFLIYLFLYEE